MIDKEALRRRKCTGKHRHKTFSDAQRQLAVGKRHQRDGKKTQGLKMNIYHCEFCNGWHTGHTPRGKK